MPLKSSLAGTATPDREAFAGILPANTAARRPQSIFAPSRQPRGVLLYYDLQSCSCSGETDMLDLRNMAIVALSLFLLVQTGCTPAVETTAMTIDRFRYDPAVARYPVPVGVYFPDDFYDNNFYHTTADDYQLTFHNNPADATRQALGLAFAETFAEVRYLDTLQQGLAEPDLAFVIVPNIVSMPSHLDQQIIAVGVVYQFEFFSRGKHLYSWQVSGLDFAKQPATQSSGGPGSFPAQGELSRRISAEKFDAVARGAVWDAISVLLARLDQQQPLTARLPAPVVTKETVKASSPDVDDPVTLALIGPVYDQRQAPDKQRLESCMLDEIGDNDLSLQPLRQDELRDQLFPWLSRSNYPEGLSELEAILGQSAVRERLGKLGVDYVLSWDGETISSPFTGPFYVTAYGVVGYESADKVSTLRADLLAVKDGRVVTSFASTREGTDAVLGLVLVPVPIPANTEGAVCDEMTREIDTFLQSVRAANRVTAGNRVQQ